MPKEEALRQQSENIEQIHWLLMELSQGLFGSTLLSPFVGAQVGKIILSAHPWHF